MPRARRSKPSKTPRQARTTTRTRNTPRSAPTPSGENLNDLSPEVLRLMLQSRSLEVTGDRATMVRRLEENSSNISTSVLTGNQSVVPQPARPVHVDFSPAQIQVLSQLIQDGVRTALAQQPGNQASTPQAQQLQRISDAAQTATETAQAAVEKATQALTVAGETSQTSTHGINQIMAPLTPATKQKILAGEYLDFSTLLPDQVDFEGSSGDITFQCDTSNSANPLRIVTKPKTRKITSIEQWLSAFSVYIQVVVSGFPGRALELLKYQDTIRLAAQKFKGMAWYVYDQTFRRRAALDDKIPWDKVDLELWTVTFVGNARPHCPICASINHTANFCPLRESPHRQQRSDRRRSYCYDYNKRTGCTRSTCSFSHSCSTCGEPHSASTCSASQPRENTYKKSRLNDCVIAVDDTSTVNVPHTVAVNALKAAGGHVTLRVRRLRQESELEEPPTEQIILSKGTKGLGFSIAGGRGNQHIQGDNGIFITKIIDGGAAHTDERLQVGDKIISVNGISLLEVTHEEAVAALKTAHDQVVLCVQPAVATYVGRPPSQSSPQGE